MKRNSGRLRSERVYFRHDVSAKVGEPVVKLASVILILLSSSVPNVVMRTHQVGPSPLWVAAEAALDGEGQLNKNYLPRAYGLRDSAGGTSSRGSYEGLGPDACRPMLTLRASGSDPRRSLADLANTASAAYHAEILEIKDGFFNQSPGVLLRARVLQQERAANESGPDIYVFYRYARFRVGGMTFCEGGRRPRIGDEFVVMTVVPPTQSEPSIVVAEDGIFFRGPHGEIEAQPSWSERVSSPSGPMPFDKLASDIRERPEKNER
jgi:hypothetical protein